MRGMQLYPLPVLRSFGGKADVEDVRTLVHFAPIMVIPPFRPPPPKQIFANARRYAGAGGERAFTVVVAVVRILLVDAWTDVHDITLAFRTCHTIVSTYLGT